MPEDKKVWLATIKAIDELQRRQDNLTKAVLLINGGMEKAENFMNRLSETADSNTAALTRCFEVHEKRLQKVEKRLNENGKV